MAGSQRCETKQKNRKIPTALSRLRQDYIRLNVDPLPYIAAEPLPSNILEWHYVVKGPEETPYQGGYYHGVLQFPREFPFKPPAILMLTPNGRFKTNTRLCLSISDFHPDTWNPTWSVSTILIGVLSFMLETTPTLGSLETSVYEKQQYAQKSLAFNLKNATFRELFPKLCEEINERLKSKQILLQNAVNPKTMTRNGQSSTGYLSNRLRFLNSNSQNSNANANVPHGWDSLRSLEGLHENNGEDDDNNSIRHNLSSFSFNLALIISFTIFALIVNYIIKNMNNF